MIYPISDPNLPFLGIHLTKTVDGQIEVVQMQFWHLLKRDINGVTLMFLNLVKQFHTKECGSLARNTLVQEFLRCIAFK